METLQSRTSSRRHKPFHIATLGRVKVPVYRRQSPGGHVCFMVSNYASGKRRFDSHPTAELAIEAAGKLARQLSERNTTAAKMTEAQAMEYAVTVQTLLPYGVTLTAVAEAVSQCLKSVGGLADMIAASKDYAARHKRTVPKRVADVVTDLLAVKKARHASPRYLQDLRVRLTKFAGDFVRDACNITTADIQAWLDGQGKLSSQSYANYRRVIHLLFKFAVARGYASDNPVEGVERVKVRNGEIAIYTATEIQRLLAVASPEFLPCIALGAFAGLRSAEIERLEWSDIHLAEKFIVIGASKAKTAGRRIVPIHDNLAEWLAPYALKQGKVWTGGHDEFYEVQQATAKATEVEADSLQNIAAKPALKWKANALRHSYASYRFAQINDAGRIAGECGNSAAVIHRHYRELVKPADAVRWFGVKPEQVANVATLTLESQL